jgi:eukaryotic-like serine/threonine-protein kinase
MALEGKQFSHYRILRLIGRGGMGEVYVMEDLRVQGQVAAKFIRLELMQPDQEAAANALRLFWREATAIAQLNHPAILPLYDHGEEVIDAIPVAYLIMPYRPEGSLVTLHSRQVAGLRYNH